MNQPVSRALEDAPVMAPLPHDAKVYPRPGDPGTRTIELHDANGRRVGRAAIPATSEPDVVVMADRVFAHSWRGGYVEKVAARVQVHA